ncbi:hypothetical protein A5882_003640 [Enterococcus sp. 4E1_DIV0656]|uniref:hypothetical protein n=1 Tax=Enterococcus sp. 4E1_DIV0656 TaxID=1834180 RepID=UPI000A367D05|nr:hypothetical protein [Enterococcus sp. 4E1_DIV0656]OTO09307.1 hypothetical protein A5882_003640 [Enterococcus sp. 4E1_DIV0656]
MNEILINTNSRLDDGTYKITFTVTYPDKTYVKGEINCTEAQVATMRIIDMKKAIIEKTKFNFTNEIQELVINSNSRQPAGNYKISFISKFEDKTHIDGHVFISESDFSSMTLIDMKAIIKKNVLENFYKGIEES